jgi:hypothetical protein
VYSRTGHGPTAHPSVGVQGIRFTRRRRARCTRARTRSRRGRIESRCCSGAVRGKHTSLAPGARARASAGVLGPPLLLATQLHSAARDGPGRQWGWPRCGLTQSRAAAASCGGGSERKAVLNLCTELPVPEGHSVVGLPRRRDRGCGRWDGAARASPAHPSGAEDRPRAEVVDHPPSALSSEACGRPGAQCDLRTRRVGSRFGRALHRSASWRRCERA